MYYIGNNIRNVSFSLLMVALLAGCNEETPPTTDKVTKQFPLGGQLVGLDDSELVLSVNDTEQAFTRTGERFVFNELRLDGSSYEVAVRSEPLGYMCLIEGGSGVINGSAADDIEIECRTEYSLSGTVIGLVDTTSSGLALRLNDGEPLSLSDASFSFDDRSFAEDGRNYELSISQQPKQQLCQIANGSGEVQTFAVDDILVTCRSWQSAERVDGDGDSSHSELEAQLAMNAKGGAMAVWKFSSGSNVSEQIWSRSYAPATDWSEAIPRQLDLTDTAARKLTPRVAINNKDEAVAVWSGFNSGDPDINVSANQYLPITAWKDAEYIDKPKPFGGDVAFEPQIATNSNIAIAVWQQIESSQSRIFARTYDWASNTWADAAFSIEGDFAMNDGNATNAQVAINSKGQAVAIWQQKTIGGSTLIWANVYQDSIWGRAKALGSSSESDFSQETWAQVAVDESGNAVAIWQLPKPLSDGEPVLNLFAKSYSPKAGEGWIADAITLDEGVNDKITPDLAMNSHGQAMVVWQKAGRIWAINYTKAGDVGVWDDAPLKIDLVAEGKSIAEQADSFDPQVAMNDINHTIIAWEQADESGDATVWAKVYAPQGSDWANNDASAVLSQGSGSASAGARMMPKVAIDDAGNAVVIGQVEDQVNRHQLWSASFKTQ